MNNEFNISELCLSDGFGGLELYALKTFKKLRDLSDHSIAIVRNNTFLENKMEEMQLPYIGFSKASRYLPIFSAILLHRILKKNQIKVLHIHWSKDVTLAVLVKLLSRGKLRIVYTRQMEIYGNKHDWYHKFIYGNIDLFLTISNKLVKQATQLLPISKEKIKLLYYGTQDYKPANSRERYSVRKKFNIDEDDFLVGTVGRIEHAKGQHLLVEAIEYLHRSSIPVHALIVGNAQDSNYLARLRNDVKQKDLEPYVHFIEFVNNPKDVMHECDVVVLTTYTETFGLVLIESMSAGTAVIGTDSGGVPEIIRHGETGLLFQPGDSQGLANCLQKMFHDPDLRKKLVKNGKKLVHENFNESKHYEKLFGLLRDLADNGRNS